MNLVKGCNRLLKCPVRFGGVQPFRSPLSTKNRPIIFLLKRSLTSQNMEDQVLHDEKKNLFYMNLGDGDKAILEYTRLDHNTLDFYHTEVPTNHRGKGIAKHLVKESLDYAFIHNLKVKATCSYVAKYVLDNCSDTQRNDVIT